MMFGPPDEKSTHTEQSMKWGIKRFSNDELRQKFVDATKPQADLLGIEIPDSELKWNEENERHDFGEPNWNELFEVIKGNGTCNKQRLAARNKAWDEGAWVRDAATVYAEKKSKQQAA